jgi:hypothetical protein
MKLFLLITLALGIVALVDYEVIWSGCFNPNSELASSKDTFTTSRVGGRVDAKRALAIGALGYELVGSLPAEWFSEYFKILADDYQITLRRSGACCVDVGEGGHAVGFNEIMLPTIKKLFGKDVFIVAARKANDQHDEQRMAK